MNNKILNSLKIKSNFIGRLYQKVGGPYMIWKNMIVKLKSGNKNNIINYNPE